MAGEFLFSRTARSSAGLAFMATLQTRQSLLLWLAACPEDLGSVHWRAFHLRARSSLTVFDCRSFSRPAGRPIRGLGYWWGVMWLPRATALRLRRAGWPAGRINRDR